MESHTLEGDERMNKETIQAAYNVLMKNYIELSNKLQDIGFEIQDAFTSNPEHSHAEYLNRIAKILGVIE